MDVNGEEKARVVARLRELAELIDLVDTERYRSQAYRRAADLVEKMPETELATRATDGTLEEVRGLGRSTSKAVAEVLTSGEIAYAKELEGQVSQGALEMLRLPSLNASRVRQLRAAGIENLEQLEAAAQAGRVRRVGRLGPGGEQRLLTEIDRLKRGELMLHPVCSLWTWAAPILSELRATPGILACELVGEARRFCDKAGRIDIVAAAADPVPPWRAYRLPGKDVPVSVAFVPKQRYGAALIQTTGSRAHLDALGKRNAGWTSIAADDEKTVYQALGLSWIPPELREGTGEVERAASGKLPRLVERSDILGATHVHSTWSDGRDSLLDMAQSARARGFSWMTVSDHGESAAYARGLGRERLRQQSKEIEEVAAQVQPMRLLRAVEADILEQGGLDECGGGIADLDVVIGSIHVRHGQDREAMTRRLVKVMEHPRMQIMGHPTGRLLDRRPPCPADWDQVFDAAVGHGVVLEVNGSPNRLDLSPDHVREILKRGGKLVLSSDAHAMDELGYVDWAVRVARRGGATKGDVLNTLGAEEFLDALR
jgi:DNA polymerase (family 10)